MHIKSYKEQINSYKKSKIFKLSAFNLFVLIDIIIFVILLVSIFLPSIFYGLGGSSNSNPLFIYGTNTSGAYVYTLNTNTNQITNVLKWNSSLIGVPIVTNDENIYNGSIYATNLYAQLLVLRNGTFNPINIGGFLRAYATAGKNLYVTIDTGYANQTIEVINPINNEITQRIPITTPIWGLYPGKGILYAVVGSSIYSNPSILIINTTTNKQIGEFGLPAGTITNVNNAFSAGLNNTFLVGTAIGNLTYLTAPSGNVIWKTSLPNQPSLIAQAPSGNIYVLTTDISSISSPILFGKNVYVVNSLTGAVSAINPPPSVAEYSQAIGVAFPNANYVYLVYQNSSQSKRFSSFISIVDIHSNSISSIIPLSFAASYIISQATNSLPYNAGLGSWLLVIFIALTAILFFIKNRNMIKRDLLLIIVFIASFLVFYFAGADLISSIIFGFETTLFPIFLRLVGRIDMHNITPVSSSVTKTYGHIGRQNVGLRSITRSGFTLEHRRVASIAAVLIILGGLVAAIAFFSSFGTYNSPIQNPIPYYYVTYFGLEICFIGMLIALKYRMKAGLF